MQINEFPRTLFAHLPTPFEPLKRLSEALGGPEIWIKRDDCTGLSTGGNKARKLEFLLADAMVKKANVIVTAGATQSNHARQTAAAAAKYGLKCHLLLINEQNFKNPLYLTNGNVLLDDLHGATCEHLSYATNLERACSKVIKDYKSLGMRPYFVPIGGSNAIGALGYVNCAYELAAQIKELGLEFDQLILATGSAGTQAGLVAGFELAEYKLPVLGMCVSRTDSEQETLVKSLIKQTLELFDKHTRLNENKISANGNYVGKGYGIPSEATIKAVKMVAELEGLLLDPVYSGKAMAGLIDYIRRGILKKGQRIVFLHTGGSTALYAYQHSFS
jgi:L-cysteate sulfo-lyase